MPTASTFPATLEPDAKQCMHAFAAQYSYPRRPCPTVRGLAGDIPGYAWRLPSQKELAHMADRNERVRPPPSSLLQPALFTYASLFHEES